MLTMIKDILIPASGSYNAKVIDETATGYVCYGPGSGQIFVRSEYVKLNTGNLKASCPPFGPADAIVEDAAGVTTLPYRASRSDNAWDKRWMVVGEEANACIFGTKGECEDIRDVLNRHALDRLVTPTKSNLPIAKKEKRMEYNQAEREEMQKKLTDARADISDIDGMNSATYTAIYNILQVVQFLLDNAAPRETLRELEARLSQDKKRHP